MGCTDSRDRLAAAQKTIAALMRRVEKSVDEGQSSFAILEQSLLLERVVAEKTRELAENQKQLEQSLRQTSRSGLALAQAQELAHLGSWTWDVDTETVTWSSGLARLMGRSPEPVQMALEDHVRTIHPGDRARVRTEVERALREVGHYQCAYRVIRGDGKERDILAAGRVVTEEEPRHVVGTRQDVTEQKELHARVARAERLASLGRLVGGAAHEINNPLAAVIANITFVSEQLGASRAGHAQELLRGALVDALAGAHRIEKVIERLRAISPGRDGHRETSEVRQAIALAVDLAGAALARDRLFEDYEAVPPVMGNLSSLAKVLKNLLLNASQALASSGGTRQEIRLRTRRAGADRVLVEVEDTGCGMSPAVLRRAFDPFFTTRPVGGGMGLGLSIAHAVIEALGGEISIRSAEGRGTTVTLLLPAAGPSTGEEPAGPDADQRPPSTRG